MNKLHGLLTGLLILLTVQIIQAATISGVVYENDGTTRVTDPIQVIAVLEDPCGYQQHVAWDHTNSSGEYTLENVPAGTVYIKTDNNNQSNYVDEWWDGTESSYDCNNAQSLSVSSEQTITDKNFQLDVGGTISGTVRDDQGTPIANLHVNADLHDNEGNCC